MEFLHAALHRLFAAVALGRAQVQIPHHAHAQARLDRRHDGNGQFAEQADQDGQAADDGAGAIGAQTGHVDAAGVTELDEAPRQRIEAGAREQAVAQLVAGDDVGDRADGAGRAIGRLPVLRTEWRRAILEMAARRQDGRLERRRVDAPADEERQALLDGAQAERLDALDIVAAPQYQFGRAAADIHHQPAFAGNGQRIGHAHVDQASLFLAGDDFDRVADGLLGQRQEDGAIARHAHGRRGHHAHGIEFETGEDGAKALQARQRPLHGRLGQVAIGVQAGGQAYRVAHALDHAYGVAIMLADV